MSRENDGGRVSELCHMVRHNVNKQILKEDEIHEFYNV